MWSGRRFSIEADWCTLDNDAHLGRDKKEGNRVFLEIMQFFTGVFIVVYDGQHGLLFTLGRAKRVVGPGVHFKWPIVQRFRIEETKDTTLDLEPQAIQLSDDLVYEVDCKVVYQIVNLHKAFIEIDDIRTGLQNRVVMAVQEALRSKNRESIRDTEAVIAEIRGDLQSVEEQWGVRIHQFGFSNISPSPATLEITQLELLAQEKLRLYQGYISEGLSEEAAVGLISGAVVALDGVPPTKTNRAGRLERDDRKRELAEAADQIEEKRFKRKREARGSQGLFDDDEENDDEERS